jgi:hypothetical protein
MRPVAGYGLSSASIEMQGCCYVNSRTDICMTPPFRPKSARFGQYFAITSAPAGRIASIAKSAVAPINAAMPFLKRR